MASPRSRASGEPSATARSKSPTSTLTASGSRATVSPTKRRGSAGASARRRPNRTCRTAPRAREALASLQRSAASFSRGWACPAGIARYARSAEVFRAGRRRGGPGSSRASNPPRRLRNSRAIAASLAPHHASHNGPPNDRVTGLAAWWEQRIAGRRYTMERRQFFGIIARGGTGAALASGVGPGFAGANTKGAARRPCDVAIVGAGLSGLTAARALTDAGIDVLALEAQERVGGRTLTINQGGTFIDHGGQWVSPGNDHLMAL